MESFDPPQTAKLPGGSVTLDKILISLRRTFDSIKLLVTNDLLVDAALTTSATRVYHHLGQPVTTWEVVDVDANAVVYRYGDSTNDYIVLKASAACNVTIRFT